MVVTEGLESGAGALLRVLVELSAAHELERVMAVTRTAARRLTGADGATFVLKDGDLCHYADEDAIEPLWKGRRFPLDHCISGWVMKHREPAIIPDIYADRRVPHEAYRPTFVRSLLMVPVREEDPVGAIGLYWATNHLATDAEIDIAKALANGAALALANVALYRDLQEAAERERRARLVAEEANQLRDQFLATVSHELRTPLGVIQGWLWQMRQPGATTALRDHALTVLERNAALQASLVENLLDASKALAGRLQLRRTPVNLARICRAAVDADAPSAAAKDIALQFHGPDDDVVVVLGDANRLEQVVRHLVANAVKFTPVGGTITIGLARANGVARLTVEDTGIGISAEFLPLVFERFRQADGTMTRPYGGMGLGLTIVRHLVELHGGSVRATSAGPGAGTTMTVELPMAMGIAQPEAGPSALATAH